MRVFKSIIISLFLMFSVCGNVQGFDWNVGVPPGSDTEVPFNDGGEWSTDSAFTFDKSTDKISAGTLDLTGVTDGYFPYMQAAGAGFGDSPLSTDGTDLTSTGDITATDFIISGASIGTPTYSTQNDFNNSFGSAGRKTGGVVTDAGSSKVAVTAGTGFIKATDDDNAQLLFFNWSAPADIAIPTDTEVWIGVEYNAGSPQVVSRTSFDWDLDTEFPLARVINMTVNGAEMLSILNNPWWVTDGTTNIIERIRAQGLVVRDTAAGGLMISVPGTRNLAVTQGTVWSNLNEIDMAALDTSVTGTFMYMWYASVDGWKSSDATQYAVTQYNDVTQNTLQDMTSTYFANLWVYACPCNGKYVVLYPQAQYYKSSLAEAEAPPTVLPLVLQENGVLLGRIMIKRNNDPPVEVQSAFTTVFTASQAADHGNLSGLEDDDHTQYALLAGRSGGQTIQGGTGSGDDLTLEGSSHATNGDVLIQPVDGFTAVGPVTPTTTFAIGGGQTVKKTNVSDAAYGTSALTSDYIVAWSSLTAARAAVISTEDVESGTTTQPRVIIIKDESGNAGTYNITITLENSGTIDGAASYVITQPYQSVTIYLNGSVGFIY
jgi:hypothetical protein